MGLDLTNPSWLLIALVLCSCLFMCFLFFFKNLFQKLSGCWRYAHRRAVHPLLSPFLKVDVASLPLSFGKGKSLSEILRDAYSSE